jgi:hypothetical protein
VILILLDIQIQEDTPRVSTLLQQRPFRNEDLNVVEHLVFGELVQPDQNA